MITKIREMSLFKQILLFVLTLAAAMIVAPLSRQSSVFVWITAVTAMISVIILVECLIYRLKVKLKSIASDKTLLNIGRFFESIGYALLFWGVVVNHNLLYKFSIACLVLYTIGHAFSDMVFSEKYTK